MPAVWGLGIQDTRNAKRYPIQLAMETTQMPELQHDLRHLRNTGGQPDDARPSQPGRQARAVDIVEASLTAVITAKQRIGGHERDIKTLQDAINLWTNRHRLSGFEER